MNILPHHKLGKVCAKHPELNGLRYRNNSTCLKCGHEAQVMRSARLGTTKKPALPKEEAKERIRLRDLERNRKRREDPAYNAAQLERKKKWRENNKDRYLASNRAYDKKQIAENLQRRLSKNLRHRLRKAMLGETRGLSAVRDLGIPIAEFRQYLESKFTDGMSWDNYGEWHMDHIKPLILFDLSDDSQVKMACNYTNIQPLWAKDNHSKWCHYDERKAA